MASYDPRSLQLKDSGECMLGTVEPASMKLQNAVLSAATQTLRTGSASVAVCAVDLSQVSDVNGMLKCLPLLRTDPGRSLMM